MCNERYMVYQKEASATSECKFVADLWNKSEISKIQIASRSLPPTHTTFIWKPLTGIRPAPELRY